MLRHCVRTPYPALFPDHGAPGFNDPNNYTARPFPTAADWGVSGVAVCTPRGKRIAAALGGSLRAVLPRPVSAVADESPRCVETMKSIAAGLDIPARSLGVDAPVFDPVRAKICRGLSDDEKGSSIEEQIAVANTTGTYLNGAWAKREALLAELQDLVGVGEAPPIAQIPDRVAKGYYMGGMYVASQAMVATFLLEAGAGLPSAWGLLDGPRREELWSKWMSLDLLFNRINHGGSRVATRLGGPTLWRILELVGDESAGSVVMVGHDTNLDAIAKLAGLEWQCGPFTPNGTPPVGGLVFTRHGDGISIEALCTPFDGDGVGKVVLGRVDMGTQRVSEEPVALSSLRSRARDRIDFDCVRADREASNTRFV